MFDPTKPEALRDLIDTDLATLPGAEDDRHEYKSGLTSDRDLGDKIGKAASGFWNSGGGLFVAGVNGVGQPDGGITVTVGRQSRRDWIDQTISKVTPAARYAVHGIEDGGGLNIRPNHAVYLIWFGPSEVSPHMAPDNRYYVRAGAHTEQARHFLVESLMARRHMAKPRLSHVLSVSGFTTVEDCLEIELVAVTRSPALDVEIEVTPRPGKRELTFPLRTTLIDGEHTFPFRFLIPRTGICGLLRVDYSDLVGTRYQYEAEIDSTACISQWPQGEDKLDRIHQALMEINRSLERGR